MNGFRNAPADACHDFEAAQWEAAYDEVANLVNYEKNWDGEGAFSARPGLIDATLRLFQILDQCNSAPADVYLAPDGTIVLEWHLLRGQATIINVRATDQVEIIYRTAGQEPQFGTELIPVPIPQWEPTCLSGPNEPISFYDDGAYELAA